MGVLLELLDVIITIAENWRFWAWFISGVILAVVAHHLCTNEVISWTAPAVIVVYFGWRGYRAERDSR